MVRRLVLLLGLLCSQWALAHGTADAAAIRPGERLSDWLLRQPEGSYLPGLSWSEPAHQLPQAQQKNRLLAWLALMPASIAIDAEATRRLSDWLAILPVTGRVPIAIPDARWLQAHPDQDPILGDDHAAVLPQRPTSVRVITETGQHCAVPHQPGNETITYLRQCQPEIAERVDRAWVVQPDGRVRRFNIAPWNSEAQDEPAPGATIWAPSRGSNWPEMFSALLAEFLATQDIHTIAQSQTRSPSVSPAIGSVQAIRQYERARDLPLSSNDWGIIGLMQTPTARMAPTSDFRFSLSRAYPYSRASVVTQPFEWMEAGFRYSFISTQQYWSDKPDIPYADKSMDVKIRLTEESRHMPALAVGLLDMTGTGLFSSEYIVASKRYANFDTSLGIGWGYLGGRGDIRTPFSSVLGDNWRTRQINVGQGGNFNISSYFHGPAALFGGVQYQTPWEQLQLKLEYDGNNYMTEPLGSVVKQSSPLNAGIVYRVSPSVDITAGIERGNTAMVNIVLHGQLDKISMSKVIDPAPPRVVAAMPQHEPDWSNTAADLLAQTRWKIGEIQRLGSELRVKFKETNGVYWVGRIDRAVAVLHRDAPADIKRFVLTFEEAGLPLTEHVVLRSVWVARHTQYQAWTDKFAAEAPVEPMRARQGTTLWSDKSAPFSTEIRPSFGYIVGSASGYFLYNVGIHTPTEWRIRPDTWISGALNLRLLDNYENTINSVSSLQRVRTYQKEYVKSAQLTLPHLQATHVGQFASNQYYSLYGGMLEAMFAGVGGEWLYRSWQSPVAFGIDVNRVGQRGFKQDFSMLQPNYQVTTGHASLYLDSGWKSIQVKLSAGQYLAGDKGFTVDVKRTFDNGIAVGAFLTKTNLSEVQFGEGSYDKGVYVSIPFDAMLPFSSPSVGNFKWSGLVRDGGQKLARAQPLYDLTSARSNRLMDYTSAEKSPWALRNDTAASLAPERSILGDLATSTLDVGPQLAAGQWGPTLFTGGAFVLAASLLDRPLDRWASRHQSAKWNTLGKAANNIPFALAAGSSLLWAGMGGEMAAETGWSSLKAAAITLGTETLAKYAIGRARPVENLGTGHFDPFGSTAKNSSFPSIHMGTAYALVTPFAQKYEANWLYAVAGATAFGRIQQRQHFVSDTVAGGLIGYAAGSLMLEQQRGRRISLSPRGIQISWDIK